MDGFEAVRIAARALREEMSSECDASATSTEIVNAAARRLDVEMCPLAPDDPLLKGARAAFDDQARMVCFANEGSDAHRAALIAHELGHVRMHASSRSCSAHDIDPSQPSEVAPVGLQRVEDYGGHERRELQANVFARELLLPRVDARRLYLDEGLTARAIADKLDLPKDLVRQQLLDALLLPEEALPAVPEAPRPTSDESQDRAARHRGSPFLLQAGPGTGKTRTLVQRVLGLLADDVEPASIAILTFSNRAAGEVYERIALAAPAAAVRIWIGTFHAFGLDLVRRYHDKLDLPADPALFDRSDGISILEEILPTLGLVHYRDLWNPARELRDMLVAISRAKDELVDCDDYSALARGMIDAATSEETRRTGEKAMEVARVYELYQSRLQEHGAVDFGDLVMRPTVLLERDPAVQIAVSRRHRHVLVDEYQDVNRASARMLRVIAGDGELLWAVGDSRQSIYRFRGASSVNMAKFTGDYPTATLDQLSVNYRSSPEIVKTLVAIAPRMKASEGTLALAFAARSPSAGVSPEVRKCETPDDEIEAVVASIRELEARGVALRDQAVLCRSNGRLNQLATGLEARGVPILHLGSIFERDEVRDMLAILSLVAGRLGDGLVRVSAMPRYGLALQDVYAALGWLREHPAAVTRRLGQLAADAPLSVEGRDAVARLAADLDGFHPGSSPWDLLATYFLDRTRVLAEIGAATSIAERVKGLAYWQFLNFVRQEVPGDGPRIRRLLDRVRMMVLFAEERDLRRVPAGALHMDAVRLMTVHAAKGLEFDAVHVPGMTVTSFPTNPRWQACPPPHGLIEGLTEGVDAAAKRAHEEEEECLFFVAVSRARAHLRLYAANKQANGNKRKASPYLDWLRGHANETTISVVGTTASVSRHAKSVDIGWPDDWYIVDHKLKSYESCPRRFFYTHMLGVGTARSSTAYTHTEHCLYELIEWLATSRAEERIGHEQAIGKLREIWAARGPTEHAFAGEYLRLAETMARRMVSSGDGLRFHAPVGLTIDLDSGRVIVEPDELAEDPDGTMVLRRVRPGTARKDEADRTEYQLMHLAAARTYNRGHRVEVVQLTDDTRVSIDVTAKKLNSAVTDTNAAIASIRAGWFPPKVDAYNCPQCPHFFICPSIPPGKLVPG